jgi:hypothetical protein
LAAAAPEIAHAFRTDLSAALTTAATALVPKTASTQAKEWHSWTLFCREHGHEPDLPLIPSQEEKLTYFLVYGYRVRKRKGRGNKPVRVQAVQSALNSIGKGFAQLGRDDPRKAVQGLKPYHPLLKDFFDSLEKDDDPAQRALPANTTILRQLDTTLVLTNPKDLRVRDLCIVGFYWLLRPSEYLLGAGETRATPFRLRNVTFTVGDTELPALHPSLNDLNIDTLTRASLTFDDQKNAVRGERITHATTNDATLCPCKALIRLCAHLRRHHAPPDTPLYAYYTPDGTVANITPDDIRDGLRTAAVSLQHLTGLDPAGLSARSLRPGGATALLCAGIETDVIKLVGRWKSDAMMTYLRVAALAHTRNLAQDMLQHGAYTFTPAAAAAAQPVPNEAPATFVAALAREALATA